MLARLEARNFRNLSPLIWEPGPGAHLLLGGNGAGKTSVLEAIYVLTTTRSFRTPQLSDCRRHGADGFHLAGEIEGEARVSLEVGWTPQGRRRSVNGREGPLAEHLAAQPVVVWTADDADTLTGPPRLRRRLLDRGVLGLRPAALEGVARYRQALAHKRRLLADAAEGGGRDGAWRQRLEPWNAVLAAAAEELIRLRQAYFEKLTAALGEVLADSGLPFPEIELAYKPSPAESLEGPEKAVEAFAAAADRELRQGRPVLGPHRDELEVLWEGREIRRVASAGERKALTMLLAVAHGRVLREAGKSPVYLFDDADIELSAATLAAVWATLGPVRQLFASSNRPEVWEGLETEGRWWLRDGELSAVSEGSGEAPGSDLSKALPDTP